MASDVREYLRAAQAAEIRGDVARAVELLRTAAGAYKDAGNHPRAEQMLRHAQRLEARPSSLVPDGRDRRSRAADPEFAERGPTLADPATSAWCSFCCRPREEVGALVAGPAGAFICGGCVIHSSSLLGTAKVRTPPRAASEERSPVHSPSRAQGDAIASLSASLADGARLALLIGPEGSGKTLCLKSLEAQGQGSYADGFDAAASGAGTLLLDGAELLLPEAFDRLATLLGTKGFACILAARGMGPSARMQLVDGDRRASVHRTAEIARATGGKIPSAVLRRVEAVVVLTAPGADELEQMATRLFQAKGAAVSSELVERIAREAFESGHGGHEVKALVDRVPKGAWKPASRPARSRRSIKEKRRR